MRGKLFLILKLKFKFFSLSLLEKNNSEKKGEPFVLTARLMACNIVNFVSFHSLPLFEFSSELLNFAVRKRF